jgi:PAS domain-containing protein
VIQLLTNPILSNSAMLLVAAGVAFVFAIWMIRRLRRSLVVESDIESAPVPTLEKLPLHLYNTVIQQLKQQKHELEVQNQAEQRRARTTENFSQAVLSNLSSGVLVFDASGLVRQANPAAKEILGFQSPSGMSADDIFRNASICSPNSTTKSAGERSTTTSPIGEEVQAVLREGSKLRQVEAEYITPAGEQRYIAVTVSPVPAVDGSLLGAACLITDRTEFQRGRRQIELQGEISAEMALELRTSLTTIAGYAQQLAANRDPGLAPQFAADIVSEATRLDRHIGGFLAKRGAAAVPAARAQTASKVL